MFEYSYTRLQQGFPDFVVADRYVGAEYGGLPPPGRLSRIHASTRDTEHRVGCGSLRPTGPERLGEFDDQTGVRSGRRPRGRWNRLREPATGCVAFRRRNTTLPIDADGVELQVTLTGTAYRMRRAYSSNFELSGPVGAAAATGFRAEYRS